MSEIFDYIELTAEHSLLKSQHNAFTVTHTANAVKCFFNFTTEDWTGLTKKAVFCLEGTTPPSPSATVTLDANNSCYIPASVLTYNGVLTIGVFGTTTNLVLPTNLVRIKVNLGSYRSSPSSV